MTPRTAPGALAYPRRRLQMIAKVLGFLRQQQDDVDDAAEEVQYLDETERNHNIQEGQSPA